MSSARPAVNQVKDSQTRPGHACASAARVPLLDNGPRAQRRGPHAPDHGQAETCGGQDRRRAPHSTPQRPGAAGAHDPTAGDPPGPELSTAEARRGWWVG
jgi:hypothetical protein